MNQPDKLNTFKLFLDLYSIKKLHFLNTDLLEHLVVS